MIIDSSNYCIEKFLEAENIKEERYSHLLHSFSFVKDNGYFCEFGVFKGKTINFIADNYPNNLIHGFDSFEGLPEDWILNSKEKIDNKIKHPKGTFSIKKLPKLKNNIVLHKGFFDKSLPAWIKKQPENFFISFLHMDCDLYSSCKFVLEFLNSNIKKGTVIVFDDFYRWDDPTIYESWKEGEYKALEEWMKINCRKIKILSRTKIGWQTAIQIIE